MSVRAWVTDRRMDHAARLICEGVKIEAVSLLVGYRSKKNFYFQFRRKYGTTPFDYAPQATLSASAQLTRGLTVDAALPKQ